MTCVESWTLCALLNKLDKNTASDCLTLWNLIQSGGALKKGHNKQCSSEKKPVF